MEGLAEIQESSIASCFGESESRSRSSGVTGRCTFACTWRMKLGKRNSVTAPGKRTSLLQHAPHKQFFRDELGSHCVPNCWAVSSCSAMLVATMIKTVFCETSQETSSLVHCVRCWLGSAAFLDELSGVARTHGVTCCFCFVFFLSKSTFVFCFPSHPRSSNQQMRRPPRAPCLLQECRLNMSSGTVQVSFVNNHFWHRITSKLICSSPPWQTVSLRVQDLWSVTKKPHIQRRGFSNDLAPTACFDFLGATFSLRFYPPSFARGSRHAHQNTHFTQRVRATPFRHEHASDLPANIFVRLHEVRLLS